MQADRFIFYGKVVLFFYRLAVPPALDGVEIQEVGPRRGVARRIVDLDDLQFRVLPGASKGQTADTPKSVDAYLHVRPDSGVIKKESDTAVRLALQVPCWTGSRSSAGHLKSLLHSTLW